MDLQKGTKMPQITIEISQVRYEWLLQMARERRKTPKAIASAIVHNATLDFQRDHYPGSHPDEGTAMIGEEED